MTSYPTTVCGSCKQPVIWTVTDKSKRMPVDAQPTADGTVALTVAGSQVRSRVVEAKFRFGRRDLHKAHFSSCPQAKTWRRR
ncbi:MULTISPECIES: hypothetical protein [Micromonospora]|uniref:hypothetical protein n=1 Tax=Micromonospora TaxID=1873 RepID=UPI0013B6FD4F|nr:hypothetical protein [Micromonospora aurantiaca]